MAKIIHIIKNRLTLYAGRFAYNHLGYTQDTHHPNTSPLCFHKYTSLIISVGQLLICIVLQQPKLTDRAGRSCA